MVMTLLLISSPPISISHQFFRCRCSNSRDVVSSSPSFSRPAASAPRRACLQARTKMIIIEFSVSNLAYRILITLFTEEWGTSLITDSFEASNTIPADDIEVQIMDLKECYKKRRGRRTVKGPVEDHLADSKVTVMIHASEEISNVRAFTQRCPDAARRTHDTIGRSLQTVIFFVTSKF